jgi:hypothetical protein
MTELVIKESSTTPFIRFSPDNQTLTIKGRSTPENPVAFYEDLVVWLDEFFQVSTQELVVRMYFKYINTSSLKCILEILKKVMNNKTETQVAFEWLFDNGDDDMRELGTDIEELLHVQFQKIPVQD